jgi:hypothetical protein
LHKIKVWRPYAATSLENPLVDTPLYLQGMGRKQGGDPWLTDAIGMHFGSPHRCGSDHFEEEKCGNHLQQQAQITSLWTPPYTFRVWGESKGGTQGKLMQLVCTSAALTDVAPTVLKRKMCQPFATTSPDNLLVDTPLYLQGMGRKQGGESGQIDAWVCTSAAHKKDRCGADI